MKLASWLLGLTLWTGAAALRQSADDGSEGSAEGPVGDLLAFLTNHILGSVDLAKYGVQVSPLKCDDPGMGWNSHVSVSCSTQDVLVKNPPPAKGHLPFKEPYLLKLEGFNIALKCSLGAVAKYKFSGSAGEPLCNITEIGFLPMPPTISVETARSDHFINQAFGLHLLDLHGQEASSMQKVSFDGSNIDLFLKRFASAKTEEKVESDPARKTPSSDPSLISIDQMKITMISANLTVNGAEIKWMGTDTEKMIHLVKSSKKSFSIPMVLQTFLDVVGHILLRHFGSFVKGFVDLGAGIGNGIGDFVDKLNPFAQKQPA